MDIIRKHQKRILVFSVLILLVHFISTNPIKSHYEIVVYILFSVGILSFVLIERYILKQETLPNRFVTFIDTISVVWTFFVVFYFVATFLIYPARVSGPSMEDSFLDGDIVFIRKTNDYTFSDVVFVDLTDYQSDIKEEFLIKRIIGTPGDVVEVIDGMLYINEYKIDEPYLSATAVTLDFAFDEVCVIEGVSCSGQIPDKYYLVMGDNRQYSGDSREFGLIHQDDLNGVVVLNVREMISW